MAPDAVICRNTGKPIYRSYRRASATIRAFFRATKQRPAGQRRLGAYLCSACRKFHIGTTDQPRRAVLSQLRRERLLQY